VVVRWGVEVFISVRQYTMRWGSRPLDGGILC
jgi:hypothetical protein